MKQIAGDLLKDGAVSAVVGWKAGDFPYDTTPAFFRAPDELDALVYNGFCASNLSKYLLRHGEEAGRVLAFLKPCDTYNLNQLLNENRTDREKLYVVGVGCDGMIDPQKLRNEGVKGIEEVKEDGDTLVIQTLYGAFTCSREDMLLEKCQNCKGKDHMVYDMRIGAEDSREAPKADRFAQVADLEWSSPDERFDFWRAELSKCFRCNACRAACPACTCHTCVFESASSGVGGKANTNDFEENLYHIIRAFHVAGRCTDCGECSRVCPQNIPLHLLNRKLIKDINAYYGEYQAGATADQVSPLLAYTKDDAGPDVISKGKGAI